MEAEDEHAIGDHRTDYDFHKHIAQSRKLAESTQNPTDCSRQSQDSRKNQRAHQVQQRVLLQTVAIYGVGLIPQVGTQPCNQRRRVDAENAVYSTQYHIQHQVDNTRQKQQVLPISEQPKRALIGITGMEHTNGIQIDC